MNSTYNTKKKISCQCVKPLPYNIYIFLTYERVSPSYKSFLETLNQIMIPNTIDETLKYPHWKETMNEEMQALIKNKTWDVVDKPTRKNK